MNFTGPGIDNTIQIGKDGYVSDTGGPFSCFSSSEMLNQLPFPFLEFSFHDIRLYGFGKFPTP